LDSEQGAWSAKGESAPWVVQGSAPTKSAELPTGFSHLMT